VRELDEIRYWHDFIEGDLQALSILFMHYGKGLGSYGMKICRDEELVKDSIQEVFIQLIQKRHKLKPNEKHAGMVYTLLRNTMADEIKQISRCKKINNMIFNNNCRFEVDAEHLYISFEEEIIKISMLSSALDQLSSLQREVLFLKYSNGFSYDQISEKMNISIASARTQIYRALKRLKSILCGDILTKNLLKHSAFRILKKYTGSHI
jgi:RNA polymerase sigma factor (sigma-70 family)